LSSFIILETINTPSTATQCANSTRLILFVYRLPIYGR
jgi:hypothetical protein